jgi:hypothetical protein
MTVPGVNGNPKRQPSLAENGVQGCRQELRIATVLLHSTALRVIDFSRAKFYCSHCARGLACADAARAE